MRFSPIPQAEQIAFLSLSRARERFAEKISPEPTSGCWLWTDPVAGWGHGSFAIKGSARRWRSIGAHRASWLIHRGPIPDGLVVCHKCDVASCVNPDHLFLGTSRDNVHDCIRKGRNALPPCLNRKLTEKQVAEIRLSSDSNAAIARQLGVNTATVRGARIGLTFAHLPGATPSRHYKRRGDA